MSTEHDIPNYYMYIGESPRSSIEEIKEKLLSISAYVLLLNQYGNDALYDKFEDQFEMFKDIKRTLEDENEKNEYDKKWYKNHYGENCNNFDYMVRYYLYFCLDIISLINIT